MKTIFGLFAPASVPAPPAPAAIPAEAPAPAVAIATDPEASRGAEAAAPATPDEPPAATARPNQHPAAAMFGDRPDFLELAKTLKSLRKMDEEIERHRDMEPALKKELAEYLSKQEGLTPFQMNISADMQPQLSDGLRETMRAVEEIRLKISLLPNCIKRFEEARQQLRTHAMSIMDRVYAEIRGAAQRQYADLRDERFAEARRGGISNPQHVYHSVLAASIPGRWLVWTDNWEAFAHRTTNGGPLDDSAEIAFKLLYFFKKGKRPPDDTDDFHRMIASARLFE